MHCSVKGPGIADACSVAGDMTAFSETERERFLQAKHVAVFPLPPTTVARRQAFRLV